MQETLYQVLKPHLHIIHQDTTLIEVNIKVKNKLKNSKFALIVKVLFNDKSSTLIVSLAYLRWDASKPSQTTLNPAYIPTETTLFKEELRPSIIKRNIKCPKMDIYLLLQAVINQNWKDTRKTQALIYACRVVKERPTIWVISLLEVHFKHYELPIEGSNQINHFIQGNQSTKSLLLMKANYFGEIRESMTPVNLAAKTLATNLYIETRREISQSSLRSNRESTFRIKATKKNVKLFGRTTFLKH